MVSAGSERIAAERLGVSWSRADAAALPWPEASFDRVISYFGRSSCPIRRGRRPS